MVALARPRQGRGVHPPGHHDHRYRLVPSAGQTWLWQCLLQLPVRQRVAIVLRYYEDLTEAQTAGSVPEVGGAEAMTGHSDPVRLSPTGAWLSFGHVEVELADDSEEAAAAFQRITPLTPGEDRTMARVSGLTQLLRVARWLAAVVISTVAVAGLSRLIVPATTGPTGEPPGVRHQLAYLRQALDAGAGEQAQRLFPEGYLFLHALYGLTWVELGQRSDDRSEALREARWALSRLDTPAGRAPFSPDLTPSYGVFYVGWTSWLRGGVLSLQPAAGRAPAEVARFTADTAALAAAFDESASPYLPAYPGQAWPVDSTVAVAALRLHDALLPPRFGDTVSRWVTLVRERLDPLTGLMPHRVEVASGAPIEVARGTSQSVIQRFLADIDPAFAREQYLRFRDRFVVSPLGLGPAVREYPSGVDGPGDVDSGPLLLGVSLSATVVTLGAAQVQGDASLAGALASYGEFAGVPLTTPSTKRYAFGSMPIGDAFLAWSTTARPWITPVPPAPPPAVHWWWRAPLVALLTLLALLPWLPALARGRGRLVDASERRVA